MGFCGVSRVVRNYTKSTMFSLSFLWHQGIVYCTCGQCLIYSEFRRKFNKLRLDATSIPDYVMKKGATHGARHGKTEVQREYHMAWNAWKRCCNKVDSQGEHFTGIHDFSEIQFTVNHNSQSDGQNNNAKSGMNLRKKTIHVNLLQRKRQDTKDNGILLWTKQTKMGLWNFDLILEPLSWWKIAYTTESGEQIEEAIHPGQQRRIQQGQEVFSEDYFSSARVETNIQDGNIGFHLQFPRGGTHPNEVGSELTIFFCSNLFFVLQLVSFTADSDPL